MDSKMIKKQLTIVLAFLLVAIFALGGATYAWLSINDHVSANKMKIVAEAEGLNFEITGVVDTDGDPDFGTTGKTEENTEFVAIDMKPIHPVISGGDIVWNHYFSQGYDTSVKDTDTLQAVTLADPDEDGILTGVVSGVPGNYVLHVKYWVRLNPTSTDESITLNNITAKNVQFTGAGADKYGKSARLVVKGPTGNAYEIRSSSSTAIDANDKVESGSLVASIDRDTAPQLIDVYVFFEGEDENCLSEDFEGANLTISVIFEGELGTKS